MISQDPQLLASVNQLFKDIEARIAFYNTTIMPLMIASNKHPAPEGVAAIKKLIPLVTLEKVLGYAEADKKCNDRAEEFISTLKECREAGEDMFSPADAKLLTKLEQTKKELVAKSNESMHKCMATHRVLTNNGVIIPANVTNGIDKKSNAVAATSHSDTKIGAAPNKTAPAVPARPSAAAVSASITKPAIPSKPATYTTAVSNGATVYQPGSKPVVHIPNQQAHAKANAMQQANQKTAAAAH